MPANIAAYKFVAIDDPQALAAHLHASAAALDLRGTVLVAGEGINLFLFGGAGAIDGFIEELHCDARFADMPVKRSESAASPFGKLKVKVKPEIISFRREDASPLLGRAPSVAPRDLARWIARGHDDAGKRLLLLDTRNREEVAHGTFVDALALPIDRFTQLPKALAPHRASMADATVVSFCTGGIRCEKAALWMQAGGMDNVLQLEGGILGYFEAVGGAGYAGDCFVFDERIALDPSLKPRADRAAA
jgi:UPF0176 protein